MDIGFIGSVFLIGAIVAALILTLWMAIKEGDERFELIKEKTIKNTFILYLGYATFHASKEIYDIWNHIPKAAYTTPYFASLGALSILFLISYFIFKRKYS